jgi:hypothetical protein
VSHTIGIVIKKNNRNRQYLQTQIGGSFFNKIKAIITFGAKAHKKLKLFGAVE